MLDPQQQIVADKVVMTPAERAVLCEQAQTLKVELDAMIQHLQEGTPREVLDSWIKSHIPWDYMHEVIGKKITLALFEIHQDEQGGDSDG